MPHPKRALTLHTKQFGWASVLQRGLTLPFCAEKSYDKMDDLKTKCPWLWAEFSDNVLPSLSPM